MMICKPNLRIICVVLAFIGRLYAMSSPSLYTLGKYLLKQYKSQRINFREDPDIGNRPILQNYDFVIIGSGSGGSSVGNRLSEVADWNVLILEAGKDGSILTDIPSIVSYLQFTNYNWGYRLERNEGVCLGMKDQRCRWPRGKGIGGSSLINYMIYHRGSPQYYNSIEGAGNPGWGYKDTLPYFMKSEKINIPEYMNSSVHSRKGYVDVERIPYKTDFIEMFLNACKEIGYDEIDYNSGQQLEGCSRLQVSMRSGRRVSAAKAYLESVKNRKNLHISEKSHVTKILIDPTTMRAIGVEFVKNKRKRVVYANKEVILSAGALNSPQLLMLSGIGPKEHLNSHGIPVINDLPVGKNLQDHFTMPGLVYLVNSTDSLVEDKDFNMQSLLQWLNQGRGKLTLAGGCEGIGFFSTKYNNELEIPDMELILVAGSLASDSGRTVKDSMGISDDFYNSVYSSINNRNTISVFPILLKPRSRGQVLLQDSNPWHWPLLYHNYFKDPMDLDVMVEGIKKVLELQQTEAFKSVNATPHEVPFPGCTNLTYASDDYWKCTVKTLSSTFHHMCCTCKMGPSSDSTTVVDPRLRVHGIKGLRVVDASIFPVIPNAHTNAPTLMVGEKAADMIKEDWLINR